MKQYRFVYKSDGWHTQIRRFGIWWRVDNVGPFGYSGANISAEWAKDCLIANILHAGLSMVPALRDRRMRDKNVARGPVAFRCLPPNPRGQPAATEPAQPAGRGPLGCAGVVGCEYTETKP